MDMIEAILPSGRAIRLKRLTTPDVFLAQERAADNIGTKSDPGGVRLGNAMTRELMKICLKQITQPLEWVEVGGEPDVDAMLDSADKNSLWIPITDEGMATKDGPMSFDKLFEDIDDFEAFGEHAKSLRREKKKALQRSRVSSIG